MDSERFREGMELRRPYRAWLRIVGALVGIPASAVLIAPFRHLARHSDHGSHRPLLPFVLSGLALLAVSVALLTIWWRLAGRDAARNGDRVPGPYDY